LNLFVGRINTSNQPEQFSQHADLGGLDPSSLHSGETDGADAHPEQYAGGEAVQHCLAASKEPTLANPFFVGLKTWALKVDGFEQAEQGFLN
jgi:hypothetical protein